MVRFLKDAYGRKTWSRLLYLTAGAPLGLLGSIYVFAVWLWAVALTMASYPLWWWLPPRTVEGFVIGDYAFNTWPRVLVPGAIGFLLLLAAPWVTQALTVPDRLLVQGLLRPTRSARLQETRTLAVDASAAALRRIERDLHDGAQAQLVALAMKLGLAKEELGSGDSAAALALVDTAHHDAKQAIAELRDLARGIHPPVLTTGSSTCCTAAATRWWPRSPTGMHCVPRSPSTRPTSR